MMKKKKIKRTKTKQCGDDKMNAPDSTILSIEISNLIPTIISVIALLIAWIRARQNKKEIDQMKVSYRNDILRTILEIETQLNERKSEYDRDLKTIELTNQMFKNASEDQRKMIKEEIEILSRYTDASKENYFNAVDRLAFCILGDYIPEKEWRKEYREMINNIVRGSEKDFGTATPHRNIKALYDKWQSS